jgi:acetyl esterase/lipase
LAITTMLRLRQLGLPLPAASMLLSPWVDMEASGQSFDSNKERDVLLSREMIQMMAATFLGEQGDYRDPLANPLLGDLRGLPPVYIEVGSHEVLLGESGRGRDVGSLPGNAAYLLPSGGHGSRG